MPTAATLKAYYQLTKPGVLYGNAITAAAGFLLASRGHIDFWLFVALFVGTTLVIAAACVLNNFLDQDIDRIMERTKKRGIVSGEVPGRNAVVFSIILGLVGITILVLYTNWLVVGIGLIGFVDYVLLYGVLGKRLSVHGTLVGSISGAMPILAGYCAVTGQLDLGALLVFLVLFWWQMPEFYSISIYRHDEYKAAGLPVMSVVKGIKHTKLQIFCYTAAFVITTLLLSLAGYTGLTYAIIMGILGLYWLYYGSKGLKAQLVSYDNRWARHMFHVSLIILLVFCGLISIDSFLP